MPTKQELEIEVGELQRKLSEAENARDTLETEVRGLKERLVVLEESLHKIKVFYLNCGIQDGH